MRATLLLAALLPLLAATAAPAASAGTGPRLRDAWIALPAPGVRVAAGYLTLDNRDPRPLRIVAVRVAGFARAELHETYREGERMRMRPRPTLEVGAAATLALEPGALHLMLFDPARPVAVGAVHALTLVLADGRELTARATVRDLRAAPTDPH